MSNARKRNIFASISGGTLALMLFLSTTPAQAEDTKNIPSGETVSAPAPVSPELGNSAGVKKYSDAELENLGGDPRVLNYWTPERMAAAKPVEAPTPEANSEALKDVDIKRERTSKGQTVAEPAEATDSHLYASPKAASPVTNYSKTNGKIFFKDAKTGEDYVCSGAAVNSGSKRLVSTAAHCVHGGRGGTWHQNWIFVPAYSNGQEPYGVFAAKAFRALRDWVDHGGTSGRGFNGDVAFVTTHSNEAGSRVVDAVGGHGLYTGGSRVFDVSLFGYPANLDRGQRMKACWGTSETIKIDQYSFSSISGCQFGGGASGGPWLYKYNNSTGLGSLRTVNSFGPADSVAFIAGPYFDSRVKNLYNAANNDW